MHRRLRPMLVDNVLANICWYLTGAEVKNFVMVCKDVNQAFRKEMVWQLLCMKHNFKHQSRTRTRGRKPWKTVYQRHLCVECTAPGHIMIDMNGGYALSESQPFPLCNGCFDSVEGMTLREM
mmetsp:Transcript_38312/g.73687  ORF Transcript_38312/g.73687 Transcript_38312/m.73687 type:complete len:122 (+) Transcript_38312:68-433(+)